MKLYFAKNGSFCEGKRSCKDKEFILSYCDFHFQDDFSSYLQGGRRMVVVCNEDVETVEKCIENIAVNASWLRFASWADEERARWRTLVQNYELQNHQERVLKDIPKVKRSEKSVIITKAEYGVPEIKMLEVQIHKIKIGKKVSNSLIGDPAPGKKKMLLLEVLQKGKLCRVEFKEGEVIDFSALL